MLLTAPVAGQSLGGPGRDTPGDPPTPRGLLKPLGFIFNVFRGLYFGLFGFFSPHAGDFPHLHVPPRCFHPHPTGRRGGGGQHPNKPPHPLSNAAQTPNPPANLSPPLESGFILISSPAPPPRLFTQKRIRGSGNSANGRKRKRRLSAPPGGGGGRGAPAPQSVLHICTAKVLHEAQKSP